MNEAEVFGGAWIDPDAGRVPLTDYATAWFTERPGLRPKTIQLCRYLLRRHLAPGFGTIADITEADVRRWRADLLHAGVSTVTAAKAYRLPQRRRNRAITQTGRCRGSLIAALLSTSSQVNQSRGQLACI